MYHDAQFSCIIIIIIIIIIIECITFIIAL